MELEAENLWIRSASHDFYDKKFITKYFFLPKKKIRRKVLNFFKKYFQNGKFSLKSQYKNFEKSRHFPRKMSTFFKIYVLTFQ